MHSALVFLHFFRTLILLGLIVVSTGMSTLRYHSLGMRFDMTSDWWPFRRSTYLAVSPFCSDSSLTTCVDWVQPLNQLWKASLTANFGLLNRQRLNNWKKKWYSRSPKSQMRRTMSSSDLSELLAFHISSRVDCILLVSKVPRDRCYIVRCISVTYPGLWYSSTGYILSIRWICNIHAP